MPRGRSRRLLERRDRMVAVRFHYWTEQQRLRTDDAIRQLAENEFFLSESTILQILKKMSRTGVPVKIRRPRCPKITAEQLALFTRELSGKEDV